MPQVARKTRQMGKTDLFCRLFYVFRASGRFGGVAPLYESSENTHERAWNMSKKSKSRKENNLFHKVTYMGTVLVLLACIVLLVLNSRRRRAHYEEQVAIAAANETEYIFTERDSETETESDSAGVADARNTLPVGLPMGAETNADGTPVEVETNEDGTPVIPESNTSLALTTEERLLDIVVLNGTRRQGVAGYWRDELEKAGFLNVASASFSAEPQDATVIYAQNGANAGVLRATFPNAQFTVGELPAGNIEPGEGESLPEQADVYIVLGRNDAVTQ